MKAKTKKVKTPSRLDKLEIELTNYRVQVRDLRSEISSLMQRADKVDTRINREVAALREQIQLTDEWRNRALKAEALASPPDAAPSQNEKYWTSRLENEQAKFEALEKSYEYTQKTLDQFRREDEARAFAIREIVRPFGFDLFAPMDAVRELAKMVFSQRDQIEGGKATEALLRETIKKMALLKAPPPPDCSCVRYTDSETPLTDSVVGEIVLYGTWEGRTAIATRKCAACGGTGRKQKSRLDESATPPPDAGEYRPHSGTLTVATGICDDRTCWCWGRAQEGKQTNPSRLDVGQFRATEGELKEALKLWHEGKVCTCSGGQQYHRVENSECYYEPRSEGKQANPSPPNTAPQSVCNAVRAALEKKQQDGEKMFADYTAAQSAEVKVKTPFMFSEAKRQQDSEDAEVARMAAHRIPEYTPRSEGEAVPNCPCTECSLKREKASGKPIRLLVEIVPKKDSKHGLKMKIWEDRNVTLGVMSGPSRINPQDMIECQPAMSVQELPPMPPLADLSVILHRTMMVEGKHSTEGIRAVLAACGLEVE